MKRSFFTIFRILLAIVLTGKILNWFLNFSDETNQVLNIAMFSLIGIAYMIIGFAWDNKLVKFIIVGCGAFLLVQNFLFPGLILNIVSIFCIITPLLIARFNKESRKSISTS
jgi:hypothetical protein